MTRRSFVAAGAMLPAARMRAGEALPQAPFLSSTGWTALLNGSDLSGWRPEAGWHGAPGRLNEWFTCRSVALAASDRKVLRAKPEPGGTIVNGIESHTTNLISESKLGD